MVPADVATYALRALSSIQALGQATDNVDLVPFKGVRRERFRLNFGRVLGLALPALIMRGWATHTSRLP